MAEGPDPISVAKANIDRIIQETGPGDERTALIAQTMDDLRTGKPVAEYAGKATGAVGEAFREARESYPLVKEGSVDKILGALPGYGALAPERRFVAQSGGRDYFEAPSGEVSSQPMVDDSPGPVAEAEAALAAGPQGDRPVVSGVAPAAVGTRAAGQMVAQAPDISAPLRATAYQMRKAREGASMGIANALSALEVIGDEKATAARQDAYLAAIGTSIEGQFEGKKRDIVHRLDADLQEIQERKRDELQEQQELIDMYVHAGTLPGMSTDEVRKFRRMLRDGDAHSKAYARQELAKAEAYNPNSVDLSDPKSIGQAVATVLASALGGFAAGFTGQPNYALQIIQAGNKERLEQHRAMMKGRLTAAAAARTKFAKTVQAFGSEEVAIKAEYARDLNILASRLEQQMKSIKSERIKTNIQKEVAAIRAEAEAAKIKVIGDMQERNQRSMAAEGNLKAQSAQLQQNALFAQAKAAQASAQGQPINGVNVPPDRTAFLTSTEAGKRMMIKDANRRASIATIARDVVELRDMIKDTGADADWTEDAKRKMQSLMGLYMKVKDEYGLGVIQGADMEILSKAVIEDPNDFWNNNTFVEYFGERPNNVVLLDNLLRRMLGNWSAYVRVAHDGSETWKGFDDHVIRAAGLTKMAPPPSLQPGVIKSRAIQGEEGEEERKYLSGGAK